MMVKKTAFINYCCCQFELFLQIKIIVTSITGKGVKVKNQAINCCFFRVMHEEGSGP